MEQKLNSINTIPIWHHPHNNNAFGNIENITKILKQNNIHFVLTESEFKDHTAIVVNIKEANKATKLIEPVFGRRI
jgi:hypothetical protein